MSQLSFSSFDDVLLVRDAQGRYLPASVDQILEAARQAIELKMQRGAEFTSPALVISHNHPSGNPEPSAADRVLTKRLREALSMVDVRVLDHIIVGGTKTTSFAERGLI